MTNFLKQFYFNVEEWAWVTNADQGCKKLSQYERTIFLTPKWNSTALYVSNNFPVNALWNKTSKVLTEVAEVCFRKPFHKKSNSRPPRWILKYN